MNIEESIRELREINKAIKLLKSMYRLSLTVTILGLIIAFILQLNNSIFVGIPLVAVVVSVFGFLYFSKTLDKYILLKKKWINQS